MKYQQLTGKCVKAIKEGRCLGCVGLVEEDWKEPTSCPYLPSTQDTINSIFKNLGVDRDVK